MTAPLTDAQEAQPIPDDIMQAAETAAQWAEGLYDDGITESEHREVVLAIADAILSERDRAEAERDALRAERDALAIANVALTATALYKRAEAAETDAARLRKALEPFSKYAGIVFERNFNNSDPVDSMTASDGGQVTIYAEDFFRARSALTTKGTAE